MYGISVTPVIYNSYYYMHVDLISNTRGPGLESGISFNYYCGKDRTRKLRRDNPFDHRFC